MPRAGALGRSLRVRGAHDSDWEELLALPASGRDLVTLKRSRKSPDEKPCFLSLSCAPSGGEEIVSVGLLSSARNMEVYVGEEYCGTSRGRSVGNVLDISEHEKIVLYKNFLKLESAAHACKIKLLSFGEKPSVFVGAVVVLVRPGPAAAPAGPPAPGPGVDLERVRAMVAATGATLSPGAQQLMSLVRSQQQRCVPLGEQLQAVLGSAACKRVLGLLASAPPGACDGPTCAPAPPGAGLPSGRSTEDGKAPGGGDPADGDIAPQSRPLPGRDLQLLASLLPKGASDSPGAPAPALLPVLQDVCGQVRRLRGPPSAAWPGPVPSTGDGGCGGAGPGEPPACSFLERVLSTQLAQLERRLTDRLDERLRALREHVDGQLARLALGLLGPGSPPPGGPLTPCDSGDGLSNGERKIGTCALGHHHPSAWKMIDIKIMTAVGVALLIAIVLLMFCVTSLLFKLTSMLKAPKLPMCLVLKSFPSMVTRDKITAAPSITAGCYPGLQLYDDECRLCADDKPLPPGFCDVSEGL